MPTIDDFYATLSGSAKPNRFDCQLFLPSALQTSSQLPKDLSLRITGVSLPGKNIRTTTDENIYGPSYEVAQGLTYGEEITIEFLLKNNHEERLVFNAWQDYIVSPTTYNVSYYNEYVSNMRVWQLDEQENKTAGIEIRNVYPKTVNAIEYSTESSSQIIKTTVGMTFKEWVPLEPTGPLSKSNSSWVVYDEYNEQSISKRGIPNLNITGRDTTGFPSIKRPVGNRHIDKFPGREKGIFEDAGKAVNDIMSARDKVVFAQQKVVAFRNFFKGITKNPLSNLGIGKLPRF